MKVSCRILVLQGSHPANLDQPLPLPPAPARPGPQLGKPGGCRLQEHVPAARAQDSLCSAALGPRSDSRGSPLRPPPPAPSRSRRSLRPSAHPARARARFLARGFPGLAPALSLPAPASAPAPARAFWAAEGPRGCLGNGDWGVTPAEGHAGLGARVTGSEAGAEVEAGGSSRGWAPAVPPHLPGCVFTRCAVSGCAQCPPRFLPVAPSVCIAPRSL